MRILITGANGFVGQHLMRALMTSGEDQLIAAVGSSYRSNTKFPMLGEIDQDRIEWVPFDLTDYESMDGLVRRVQPDQVYHLAGIATTSGSDDKDYFLVNAWGTFQLAKAINLHRGDECKFLFVSSSGVYGAQPTSVERMDESQELRPASVYGASKASAEMLLWSLYNKGLDLRIARPFNHTGPGQRTGFVCSDIIEKLQSAMKSRSMLDESLQIFISRIDSVRDFLDVRDVVKAYIAIMNNFSSGEVVNVSSGKGHAISDIIAILQVILADRFSFTITSNKNHSVTDFDISVGDSSKLRLITGWVPEIHMNKTLQDMSKEQGLI